MFRSIKVSDADIDLFDRSASYAENGEHRVRVGVLLAKGSRPLGASWNRERNEIGNVEFGDATVHAEQHILANVKSQTEGLTLYVSRLSLAGDWMPSFPCKRCIEAIEFDERVSKLVYFDGNAIVKVRI